MRDNCCYYNDTFVKKFFVCASILFGFEGTMWDLIALLLIFAHNFT